MKMISQQIINKADLPLSARVLFFPEKIEPNPSFTLRDTAGMPPDLIDVVLGRSSLLRLVPARGRHQKDESTLTKEETCREIFHREHSLQEIAIIK